MKIIEQDTAFYNSPDSGMSECTCSRCGNIIQEDECPVRCWTTNDQDEVDENSMEYRYCEKCMTEAGIQIFTNDDFPLGDDQDYDLYNDSFGDDDDCPNCGHEYDEIDREYQMCHLCGHGNLKSK